MSELRIEGKLLTIMNHNLVEFSNFVGKKVLIEVSEADIRKLIPSEEEIYNTIGKNMKLNKQGGLIISELAQKIHELMMGRMG